MIFLLLAAAATIGWGPSAAHADHNAAAAAALAPAESPGAVWEASNNCYYPNCTEAHKAGEGDIPSSSPHYCAKQDRDVDGFSCEW